MTVDFLLIGQGIAGSWLSYFLHKAGASFRIIDKSQYYSASAVASGIINPITGRRFVKTWLADDLIKFADKNYPALESLCGTKFYHKVRILKALNSNHEVNEWSSKAKTGYYEPFLASDDLVYPDKDKLNIPFGCFQIESASWIESHKFLNGWRSFLKSQNLIIEEEFSGNELSFANGVQWKNIKAGKVILCQGFKAAKNSFFDYLPFAVTKGECLHIYAPGLELKTILSSKISILPLGNDRYYVGSTTELNDFTLHPTSKMFNSLTRDLKNILKLPYEICGHYVGVRPTVKDRRPLIGQHPNLKDLYIFNGMGTKGYSLAPFFAHSFLSYLIDSDPIDKEVNIMRYQDKYENAGAGYSV